MRRYRSLSAVVFVDRGVRAGRRHLRPQRARDRRQGARTLQDVHRGAERDRGELRRQGRIRPPGLRRDPRHARHARSAFELLRPARIRADARAAGRALLRPRHHDSVAIDGDITAQSVFEGSPAYKKGIRRGDVIAKIAGEDAKGWTTEQAMQKLRGPKGTPVQIEIKRRGYEQPIPLEVDARRGAHPDRARALHDRRDDRLHPAAGLRREHRPRIEARAARSRGEGHEAAAATTSAAIPAARSIRRSRSSNEFLPRGKMIVYTRGRVPNSDQDYRATEDSEFTDIPMVVLANRNSASASEIVTGALQDHDRAYIVGETTFGKALVQSVYPISGGAGLALTTAHYYTPSGRLIQRPWDETFDEYLTYTQRDQDANKPHNPSDLKRTDAGRPVYSGGGIEPDKYVAGPGSRGLQPDAVRPHAVRARRSSRTTRRSSPPKATRASRSTSTGRTTCQAELRRRRRDGGGLPRAAEDATESRSTRTAFNEGPRVHQGDDPLRDRRGALRHGRGAAAPDRRSIRRRKLALAHVRRGRRSCTELSQERGSKRRTEGSAGTAFGLVRPQ